jgi:ACS family tartrate transporter-like MFS transporter
MQQSPRDLSLMNPAEAIAVGDPAALSVVSGTCVLRKVAWRLLPFLALLYLLNILDRTNVGFARLTMERDLGITPDQFDFGYGIFYLGYFLFEVPANLLLRRVGARRWISRIMISWGLVTCLTLAVTEIWGFYWVRILLGVAEAGFFPGIVLYLTFWFPARERARAMALFMIASPLGGVLGYPIAGAVMKYLHGLGDLSGWQWVFLVEGLPSVLVGILVLLYLPDGPHRARWLTPAERDWIEQRLEAEHTTGPHRHERDLLRAFLDPRIWILIGVYASVAVGSNASGARMAVLIRGLELVPEDDTLYIGLLGAVPNVCAVVAMIVLGMSSDRTHWRRTHVAIGAFAGAAGWAVAYFAPWPWVSFAGLCLAQAGMLSMLPTFWAIPTAFLSGAAAAGGIALINSVANIGGWFGPNIFGWLGMPAMMVILCAGGILVLLLPMSRGRAAIPQPGIPKREQPA